MIFELELMRDKFELDSNKEHGTEYDDRYLL